jgi:hypothetical protein
MKRSRFFVTTAVSLFAVLLLLAGFIAVSSKNRLENTSVILQPIVLNPVRGNLKPSIYGEEYIEFIYSTDGQKIYCKGEEMIGVDMKTFVPIENGNYMHSYAKDKNSVYFKCNKIEQSDPTSFVILWTLPPEGCSLSTYSKDDNNVYFENLVVPMADPKTFTPLIVGPVKGLVDKSYAEFGKDERHVFRGIDLIDNIKPSEISTECDYG